MPPLLELGKIISGISLALTFLVLICCFILRWKELFYYLKKIPFSLIGLSATILTWSLFIVPKSFSGREEFGVWLMSMANDGSWINLMNNPRALLYIWRARFFSDLFGGINYDFLVILNCITFFLLVLLIYILVYNLTESKKAAYASSIFYLITPVFLIMSLTEEYTFLAIFFMILSLVFASIQIRSEDRFYLVPALASALLAAGSRIEFIFFPYFFILFYIFFLKKYFKRDVALLSIFFLILIPRTFYSLHQYFFDAQYDTALHGRTYEYTGNLLSYMYQVVVGASVFFSENILQNITEFLNFQNLNGLIFILALVSLFWLFKKEKISFLQKKTVIFFLALFLFLFFYYEYFHAIGGVAAYRYMIAIFTPLIVLAGIGVSVLLKNRPFFFYLSMQALFLFSVFTVVIPLTFQDYSDMIIDLDLRYFVKHNNDIVRKEYEEYKKLNYENRISRLFGNENFDIAGGEDVYFIFNGTRTFLYSMPVNGNFISIREEQDLRKAAHSIPSGSKIYISQPEIGFTSHLVSDHQTVDPEKFEKLVSDLFKVKTEIIFYEVDDYHVFLYEVERN